MKYGLLLKCSESAHEYPELRERTEQMALETLQRQHGGQPYVVNWYHDAGMDWTDPETGEFYPAVPLWGLLVETEVPNA